MHQSRTPLCGVWCVNDGQLVRPMLMEDYIVKVFPPTRACRPSWIPVPPFEHNVTVAVHSLVVILGILQIYAS